MSTRTQNLQELFTTSTVVQRLMHAYMHRSFDELGLAPAQLQILQFIEHEQPVSPKRLAERMRLTPGAITQLVESLVRSNYVTRTENTDDRRVTDIALTPTGGEKIGVLSHKKQTLLKKVVADLDDAELEIFLRVQRKILAYLETNCAQK